MLCVNDLNLDMDENYGSIDLDLTPFLYGTVAGLCLLACFSDCFFKQHMLFLPILVYCVLFFFLNCTVCAIELIGEPIVNPNSRLMFVQGFLQGPIQFYLLFMTPMRIADKYRFTQEVTPAGTILASNLLISTLACEWFRRLVIYLLIDIEHGYARILLIVFVALSIAIAVKPSWHEIV